MKVGTPPKAPIIREPKAASGPSASSIRVDAVDAVTLLGIPETELTPRVQEALTGLIQEVAELRQSLHETQAKIGELEQLADRDPLVDLFNRRAFVRELNRVLAMIDRYELRASLIIADLNDLKIINDERGHAAGDAALRHIARIFTDNTRQTDVVSRLGGDEFAILLTHLDGNQASRKITNLEEIIASKPVEGPDGNFGISVSFGVIEIAKGTSVDEALERADAAMYADKAQK